MELQKNAEQLQPFIARAVNLATGVEQGKDTVGKQLTDTALADDAENSLHGRTKQ